MVADSFNAIQVGAIDGYLRQQIQDLHREEKNYHEMFQRISFGEIHPFTLSTS